MKFLCLVCDRQMTLRKTLPPDRGSVALVYSCPECGYAFALHTNPHETQLVSSLGVKLGAAEAQGDAGATTSASRCPFTGMLQEQGLAGTLDPPAPGPLTGEAGLPWTTEARRRLAGIPELVRPLAQGGIERFARDRGYREVDERVLDEARSSFGSQDFGNQG